MSSERKKIIINEIHYWKDHNLLPVVYCDFLLALYTHGQDMGEDRSSTRANDKMKGFFWLFKLLISMLIPLSLIIIYFTQFPLLLQMSFLFILTAFSFWLYYRQSDEEKGTVNYILIILLILTLLTSVHLVKSFYPNAWLVNIIIMFNLSGWFVIGIKRRYKYLYLISAFALIMMVIFNLLELYI